MIAIDNRFHACVDHIREWKLVRQSFCTCAKRVKAEHCVTLGVVSSLSTNKDYFTSVLHRTKMHSPKVFNFSDGAATDLLRELNHVSISCDHKNMAVADHSACQTTSKRQICKVCRLSDSRVVALNSRAVPVVSLCSTKDKDLFSEYSSRDHLSRHGEVARLRPLASIDVVPLNAAQNFTSGGQIPVVTANDVYGIADCGESIKCNVNTCKIL